jgi:hypothetical protein
MEMWYDVCLMTESWDSLEVYEQLCAGSVRTRSQMVVGSSPGRNNSFYCFVQMPCYFTFYKRLLSLSRAFLEDVTTHHCMPLY